MATFETTNIEVTDLFCGEPNYLWVKRFSIEHTEGKSILSIIRSVKRVIGWNGVRCTTIEYGDGFEIRPNGVDQVCFVSFHVYGNASN